MHRFLVRRGLASVLLGLALFAGCNNGGSAGADPTLSFAVTDSASDDIVSFTVEVTSVQLTRLGGAVESVLFTPVTVDLATLTDTSQILSARTVPAGTYLSASITVDFTNAACYLVGQATPAAILDEAGNPLTGPLTLPIRFGENPLLCRINRHLLLEYDFDLNQSCTTDTGANTVSIDPAFVMHVDPAAPKPLLLAGTVTSVDTASNTFVGQLATLSGTPITTVTISVVPGTLFQIDGVPSQGSAGLTALAAVPQPGLTWFEALGVINPLSPHVVAAIVHAGHGTYNGGDDIVEGHITDRTGLPGADATLTVLGHSNSADHTVFQFNTTFTVTTSFANTKVVRSAVNQAYDTDGLNVGQRVRLFGALTGTSLDATAATSVARMQPTNVFGHANGPVVAPDLQIDLTRVDFRPQTDFIWASSGATPPTPTAFNILVGNLGANLGIVSSTPVWARGFFPGIADAGDDFEATSLANLNLVPSLLFVRNRPAGLTVGATALPGGISLQISGTAAAGEIAIIDQPLVGAQSLPTSPDPVIAPVGSGPTFYVLRDKQLGRSTVYLDFADFSAALANELGFGAVIDQVSAVGVYSSTNNVIAAPLASAVIH